MNIHDFAGQKIFNPIKSRNVPDLKAQWDQVRKIRDKGQTLLSMDRRLMMTITQLYYVPGLTTYCGIAGTPVLTGFMSGCYLFRYRENGALRAAHVGTHDTNAEANKKAKDAWKSLIAQPHITDVFGYDPAKDVSMRLMLAAAKFGSPKVFGMWEGNGSVRVGVMSQDHHDLSTWTLVGVEPVPLRPWSSIQHDPKMV